MQQKSCLYCGKRGVVLHPVKKWNKDETNYYCDKHYGDAFQHGQEERKRFIEYYSVPERRKWLPEKSLELWERLNSGKM